MKPPSKPGRRKCLGYVKDQVEPIRQESSEARQPPPPPGSGAFVRLRLMRDRVASLDVLQGALPAGSRSVPGSWVRRQRQPPGIEHCLCGRLREHCVFAAYFLGHGRHVVRVN